VTDRAFDRDTLIEAFQDLGTRAYKLGKVIEISVYGGSALMLTYGWRLSTKAVDAAFEADKTLYQPALTLTCHCEPHVRRGNPGAASTVLPGVRCAKPQRLSAVATCPPVKVNAWWY